MDGWNAPGLAIGGAIRRQIAGQGTLKDPEISVQRILRISAGTPKFLASTGEAAANQSVSSVLNSLASPSSKQITNSVAVLGPRPCSECGWLAGKYQRSPWLTSAT